MKKIDKLTIVAFATLALTNQFTIGYIDYALEVFINNLIKYGMYVNGLATLTIIVVFIVKYKQANTLKIPPKTAKTQKAGKYIDYK
jgi:hypothetical protein